MKIQLDELDHQKQAIRKIIDNFPGVDIEAPSSENPDYNFANPLIYNRYKEKANIDIKMETGTGKTYVGTRTMYELHQQFGIFKFIIVVPSPAIKEGWKNFLTAKFSQQHFSQNFENIRFDVSTINAGDFKAKSGRKNMPAHLLSFVEGSRQNANTINVLLINDAMLRSASMKTEFDQTLLSGFTTPLDGLKATRPIVIMDEPHQFPRELKNNQWVGKKNYQAVESLNSQMIIRFGATFNLDKKSNERDYYHGKPQFDLNAIESFNRNLVKAVDIYYPLISEDQAKNIYKVKSVNTKELILSRGKVVYDPLKRGEDLSIVDDGFEGNLTYEGGKKLSNDLELESGMSLIPGTFSQSYQELLISDAIDKHFEKERENFFRPKGRIKTLSLFFIDSIASYGVKNKNGAGRKMGWLSQMFDRLLNEKINNELKAAELAPENEKEYYDFLLATKVDIAASRAAYFGEDSVNNDEGIQQEVDDILRNKEKMLSFKDENGNWNTRRFLFSKWTLREGWDNPNVFVIAKLRSSGSENSKIQEVGRGLRLPVDEFGHRLSDEEFRLAFLIGYDEKEFAQKLVADINKDAPFIINKEKLTRETIDIILKRRPELNELDLLEKLDNQNIIKRNNDFKEEGYIKLKQLYPELNNSLVPNKVTMNNNSPKKVVKLKKENWNQLKSLWSEFSRRYMVVFNRIPDHQWEIILENMLSQKGQEIFQVQLAEQVHQKIDVNDSVSIDEKFSTIQMKKVVGVIKYGKFLEHLARKTRLPISILMKTLTPYLQKSLNLEKSYNISDYLNNHSLTNFVTEFKKCFEEQFAELVKFDALAFEAKTTVWDSKEHEFVDEVPANYVGELESFEETSDIKRSLYLEPPLRFDSRDPELAILKYGYDTKITVFGKIPKKSIQIPKYTGGTTTPDFIYKIGSNLYLLVETKSNDLRTSEKTAVSIQQKFLKQFGNVYYQTATSVQAVIAELETLDRKQKKD